LQPGRCRYGLLLREDGFITDDGVSARLAPDRFHLTTTTGGAARVLAMMEDYLQTEWSDLDVWLTSTTEQWAVIAVQGPLARAVIAPLVEGIDLSPSAFPHMAIREGRICGVPTRLFRVSFTGELGFEVNVPAEHGRMVWEAIHAAGQAHGITPMAPRRCTCSAPKRAMSSSGRTPMARSRPMTPAWPGRWAARSPISSASARSPGPT
jgi:sarcosine oxidase subunit alpha